VPIQVLGGLPIQALGSADSGPRGVPIEVLGRPFAPERARFSYGGGEVLGAGSLLELE
jgi:hypothetical protein